VREFKALAALQCEASSDSELEEEFPDNTQALAALGQRQDSKSKSLAERTKAPVENILAVAYRRGLPWAVMEMHKTAAPCRA
jgi:hypothetical protein